MDFQVPQFIEREPKIIGPLSFNQFIIFAILGGICFVLYFSLPRTVFYTVTLLAFGITGTIMFIKKDGFPLYIIIRNSFLFLFLPKLYLWRPKEVTTSILKEESPQKTSRTEQQASQESPLKLTRKGQLENIIIKVETGKK